MPSKVPLTKSYFDRRDPKNPTLDVTLYSLWDNAKKNGFVGDILNLETGERMTNLEILDLVSYQCMCAILYYLSVKYVKGC